MSELLDDGVELSLGAEMPRQAGQARPGDGSHWNRFTVLVAIEFKMYWEKAAVALP